MKKERALPTRASLIVWGIVGAYLIYLAYSIVSNLSTAGARDYLIFTIFGGAFTIVGLLLMVRSIKAIADGKYQGGKLDTQNSQDAQADNPAAEKKATKKRRLEFGEELTTEQIRELTDGADAGETEKTRQPEDR